MLPKQKMQRSIQGLRIPPPDPSQMIPSLRTESSWRINVGEVFASGAADSNVLGPHSARIANTRDQETF